jgi:hypothetical protein
MNHRLSIGLFALAAAAFSAFAASPPFWQVFDGEWCLVDSSEKKFCIENATMTRSWRHGAYIRVGNEDADRPILFLSFEYFDPTGFREYDAVDESFKLVATEQFGTVVVKRFNVRLGDLPRSVAEYVSITEPSVFSISIFGGTEEMRSNFIDSFIATWTE